MVQLSSFRRRRRFMPQRQALPPNPYFNKTRKRPGSNQSPRRVYIGLVLILVVALGGMAWLFSGQHYRIALATVDTNNESLRDEIEKISEAYLKTETLVFFKTSNYWLLNQNNLKKFITNRLAEKVKLQSLEIKKQYPNQLNITATSYQPFVRYQGIGSITYVLDEKGIVTGRYEEPPVKDTTTTPVESPLLLPLLLDENDRAVQIGKQMASAELIIAVDSIFHSQQQYGLNFESFSIPEIHCPLPPAELNPVGETNTNGNGNTNASPSNVNSPPANVNRTVNTNSSVVECNRSMLILDTTQVNGMLVDGPNVYFSFAYDLGEAQDRLRLFLESKKAEVGGLSYIDIRFPERIYYQ